MIEASGYERTFLVFGIAQGVILFAVAWLPRAPDPGEMPAAPSRKVQQSARSFTPREMLGTPVFWVLCAMFVMVSASGLMAAAQLALIASDFGISQTVLFLGASTLAVALVVDNVANGAVRPFFGWLSDQIGRENTTVGEIFRLFPSTCTDAFGPEYATVNTSLLHTAKGMSALLVPFSNVIKSSTGRWYAVFLVAAVMNFVVVFLTLFVVKPLRRAQDAATDRVLAQDQAFS